MTRRQDHNRNKIGMVFTLLLAIASSLQADERQPRADACDMVVDAVICRPAGLVATLIGTTVWVVSLPFSLAGGNERETREKLVYEPAAYTFKRPVGSPECSCYGFSADAPGHVRAGHRIPTRRDR